MELDNERMAIFLFGILLGSILMIVVSVAAISRSPAAISGELTGEGGEPVVLFNDTSLYRQSIAFYSPESQQGIVCETSRRDEVQISESAFKYRGMTECRVVDEDLTESWDDPGFQNFNIIERGRELLENQSNSSQ